MHNRMAAGWFYSPSQIKKYFLTRITSLKPPRTKLGNPYHILKELDKHQWLMFTAGFPWLDVGCIRLLHRVSYYN